MTIAIGMFPRIDVSPSGSIDPSDSSTLSFTVVNRSSIPFWDVRPSIGVCYISPRCLPVEVCPGWLPETRRIHHRSWEVPSLVSDQALTVEVGDELKILSGSICTADINIVLDYNPWFIPWTLNRQFRFQTERHSSGALTWRSVP